MGKSPAKWFKSILRKKSSKSKLSEENHVLKPTNKAEVLVASEVPVSGTTTYPSVISQPAPTVGARSEVNSECGEVAKVPSEGLPSSCAQANENSESIVNSVSQEDDERIRRQTAATKAQTSFRGYQARCAFQTQKSSIIQLQALVRGHLVRRQATTSLCTVRAIIKIQALARGQKVRHSAIGLEVQNVCNLGKIQGKCTHASEEKLIKNVFAKKLFASSSRAVPLRLQYNPGDPNSSQKWTERWTRSQFWVSHSQKKSSTKHGNTLKKVETKQGRTKQSIRNQSHSNAENRPGSSVKDSEKPKRNQRKTSQEHPESELDKVNRNLRKASNPAKEVHASGKTKRAVKKSSVAGTPEVTADADDVASEQVIPTADVNVTPSHESRDLDSKVVDIEEATSEQMILTAGNDASHNGKVDGEIQKISERRASLPANVEHVENGVHSTPKVPSYMAPTESARAKLRGLGSPRFAQDAVESIATTRRHSLPSSTNGRMPSMSPRANKLVSSAGKGLVSSNRSMSSSRDGSVSEKTMKAEWRR